MLMADSYSHLQRTDEGPVATVALRRPEAHNALNAALIEEVARCFEELAEDVLPKPVVARVRGVAIGGGVGLVAAADIAVAEEGARFAFSEVRLGIAPATIAPFVIRKVGYSHARALFLTGERFDGGRAREIGLVHEVVPERDLDSAVERVVTQLLQGGPAAQAAIKELLGQVEATEPMEALGIMTQLIAELRVGEEGQDGLGAFLEKREPYWRAK